MERLKIETAYRGNRIDVERHTFLDNAGQTVVKEVGRHVGACCVLAFVDATHIVLIRNRRTAVDAVLWELPAGTLEPPEPAIETARRELAEEAGYAATTVEPLLDFWTAPGLWDERMHAFVATGLSPTPQALEAGEEIEPHVVALDEAVAMIGRGEIVDGKTMTTLLYWKQFR